MIMILLFSILMIIVFGKLLFWSIGAAWSIGKILLTLVFLPIILIAAAVMGMIIIAFPILVIIGIVLLIKAVLD